MAHLLERPYGAFAGRLEKVVLKILRDVLGMSCRAADQICRFCKQQVVAKADHYGENRDDA